MSQPVHQLGQGDAVSGFVVSKGPSEGVGGSLLGDPCLVSILSDQVPDTPLTECLAEAVEEQMLVVDVLTSQLQPETESLDAFVLQLDHTGLLALALPDSQRLGGKVQVRDFE